MTPPPPRPRRSAFVPGYGADGFAAFRLFFPAAALFALALPLPFLPFTPRWMHLPAAWHAHEGVFGYGGALLAGFLLTALPNWTGRPLPGSRITLLFLALWLAGRIGMALAHAGYSTSGLADLALPLGLMVFAMREIAASGNRRTRKIAVVLALFCAARLALQVNLIPPDTGLRLAVAAQMALIMLIAGRMIPVFTQMALADQTHPIPRFSGFDAITIGISLAAMAIWALAPDGLVAVPFLASAALLQGARLRRWGGWRILHEPAIAALHLAYGFIPLGLALCAAHPLWPDTISAGAGLHAFTAGALGTISLAIMIRMIEGHVGPHRFSTIANALVPGCAAVSALLRILYGTVSPQPLVLALAGTLWLAAFIAFLALYGPRALKPSRESA